MRELPIEFGPFALGWMLTGSEHPPATHRYACGGRFVVKSSLDVNGPAVSIREYLFLTPHPFLAKRYNAA
jgi:hypothetical protein